MEIKFRGLEPCTTHAHNQNGHPETVHRIRKALNLLRAASLRSPNRKNTKSGTRDRETSESFQTDRVRILTVNPTYPTGAGKPRKAPVGLFYFLALNKELFSLSEPPNTTEAITFPTRNLRLREALQGQHLVARKFFRQQLWRAVGHLHC